MVKNGQVFESWQASIYWAAGPLSDYGLTAPRVRCNRRYAGADRPTRRRVCGDETVILEDRHRMVGGAQPQRLADQGERRGVQAVVELDMAVAMQDQPMPRTQIGRDRRKRLHQRLLDGKQIEGSFTRRTVSTDARFFGDPAMRLRVQIRQVAKGARRQEVALEVLNGAESPRLRRCPSWPDPPAGTDQF